MKIGILTITDERNYGNRLQNYACYKFLKNYTDDVENIIIHNIELSNHSKIKKFLFKIMPNCILNYRIALRKGMLDVLKVKQFHKFTCSMDKVYIKRFFQKDLEDLCKRKKYDAIFVGSDQIWNPDFAGQDYYFLNFVEPHKRIAFSASIGYDELTQEILDRYIPYWKQMQYISVREETAANIIENATGNRPDVFLDPTLLITREEWDEVAKKPTCDVPEKYILCLFLGKMPEAIKEKYEKVYGLELVVLNDKAFSQYYVQGPSEFIWLIKNSELVLTDSFHCTVFSIIYQKQFWVYERVEMGVKTMFTRLETLLARFNMTDRVMHEDDSVLICDIEKERFLEADNIRKKEKTKVLDTFIKILAENRN